MKKTKLKIKYDDEFAKFHARRRMEAIEAKRKCIQENKQARETRSVDSSGSGSTPLITTIIQQNLSAVGVFIPSLSHSLWTNGDGAHMCSRAQKYYFLKLLGEHFE